MEGNYKHRVVDALLERKLLGKGAELQGDLSCGAEEGGTVLDVDKW